MPLLAKGTDLIRERSSAGEWLVAAQVARKLELSRGRGASACAAPPPTVTQAATLACLRATRLHRLPLSVTDHRPSSNPLFLAPECLWLDSCRAQHPNVTQYPQSYPRTPSILLCINVSNSVSIAKWPTTSPSHTVYALVLDECRILLKPNTHQLPPPVYIICYMLLLPHYIERACSQIGTTAIKQFMQTGKVKSGHNLILDSIALSVFEVILDEFYKYFSESETSRLV